MVAVVGGQVLGDEADFALPEGISEDLLRAHLIVHAQEHSDALATGVLWVTEELMETDNTVTQSPISLSLDWKIGLYAFATIIYYCNEKYVPCFKLLLNHPVLLHKSDKLYT